MDKIIVFTRFKESFDQEYFFSSDHFQPGLDDEWVPTTFYLPMEVTPREQLSSGVITNKEDWYKVFGKSCVIDKSSIEIPNPNPLYQA